MSEYKREESTREAAQDEHMNMATNARLTFASELTLELAAVHPRSHRHGREPKVSGWPHDCSHDQSGALISPAPTQRHGGDCSHDASGALVTQNPTPVPAGNPFNQKRK